MSRTKATRNQGAVRDYDESRGFVLVGVIIFVFALTILGLSLFSLSSFEAQFLGRSSRSTQALYDAMGGIEWAKMVLAREKKLQAVQDGQPAAASRPARVVSVEAWQGVNNIGSINYSSGEPIRIRGLADDGRGARRMVEFQFEPVLPDGLYRNLIDCHDEFRVTTMVTGGSFPGPRVTELWGPVRIVNNNDTTWETVPGVHPYAGGGVPQPKATSFINTHWGTASDVVVSSVGAAQSPGYTSIYTLDAGGGASVRFFKTEAPPGAGYSIFDKSSYPIINVSGTCVWLARKGMRFDRPVTIVGNAAEDRLIIVSEPLVSLGGTVTIPFPTGIWFFSGLTAQPSNLPVVLVSNAGISFVRGDQIDAPGNAGAISIFGEIIHMEGPRPTGGAKQVFRHDPDMDGVIDELAAKNVLPNAPAVSSSFIPIPGTWRELDPDFPS
jgi:hypothetical protein